MDSEVHRGWVPQPLSRPVLTQNITKCPSEHYLVIAVQGGSVGLLGVREKDSLLCQMDSCLNTSHSIATKCHCVQWVMLKGKPFY